MDFTCSKEKLLESINIVSRAVASKSNLPILECLYIKAKDNTFILTANDTELAIESAPLECDVIEGGSICLEAKLLSDIVKHLPDDEVSFNTDDSNVTFIKSGKSEFQILGQDSDEFPDIPIVERINKYEMFSSDLKNMIKQTIFSVSTDESKPTLNGEYIDIIGDEINIVAIDGFRVSTRKTNILTNAEDINAIVPFKTLNEISRILPQNPEDRVGIYFTDKHILFELESCVIVSRLIEGNYMNYEQVFSDDYNTKVVIDRIQFINCLERSSIISKESNKNPVKIKIDGDILIVTSNNELGKTYEELTVDVDGDAIEIAFNPRFLIDVLKSIEEDEIMILFTTALSPCIIKGVDSSDHKYLILPLRVRG